MIKKFSGQEWFGINEASVDWSKINRLRKVDPDPRKDKNYIPGKPTEITSDQNPGEETPVPMQLKAKNWKKHESPPEPEPERSKGEDDKYHYHEWSGATREDVDVMNHVDQTPELHNNYEELIYFLISLGDSYNSSGKLGQLFRRTNGLDNKVPRSFISRGSHSSNKSAGVVRVLQKLRDGGRIRSIGAGSTRAWEIILPSKG